jgi:serine/threonine-protein kinase
MDDHIFDKLSDEFEAAWSNQEQPRIETFLERVPPENHAALLCELLQIELWWRRKDSPSPTLHDYQERFSEYRDAVQEAFDAFNVRTLGEQEQPTLPPSSESENGPTDLDVTLPASSNVASGGEDPTIAPHQPEGNEETAGVGDRVRYFGDYELIDEIARGGMGVVFKARQVKLNRIVALKMILSGELAGEEEVKRFKTEAEAAANLDHPGIVPIYEIGVHNGQHYFSMGFVEGQSLADRVKEGPIPPMEAAEIVKKVTEAIAYAHEKGVIHRDLKPANVLLDANGEPRVTDFGLAKQVESDSDLTRTGAVMGTPSYMPPEQAAGNLSEIGPPSDVYSLGAVLYELLTGAPPFRGGSPLETLMLVLENELVPPRMLNPTVPRDLAKICLKCLEKLPSERYANAEELSKDLTRFLEGEPVSARPIIGPVRVLRWAQRRSRRVVITLGIIVVLIVFAALQGNFREIILLLPFSLFVFSKVQFRIASGIVLASITFCLSAPIVLLVFRGTSFVVEDPPFIQDSDRYLIGLIPLLLAWACVALGVIDVATANWGHFLKIHVPAGSLICISSCWLSDSVGTWLAVSSFSFFAGVLICSVSKIICTRYAGDFWSATVGTILGVVLGGPILGVAAIALLFLVLNVGADDARDTNLPMGLLFGFVVEIASIITFLAAFLGAFVGCLLGPRRKSIAVESSKDQTQVAFIRSGKPPAIPRTMKRWPALAALPIAVAGMCFVAYRFLNAPHPNPSAQYRYSLSTDDIEQATQSSTRGQHYEATEKLTNATNELSKLVAKHPSIALYHETYFRACKYAGDLHLAIADNRLAFEWHAKAKVVADGYAKEHPKSVQARLLQAEILEQLGSTCRHVGREPDAMQYFQDANEAWLSISSSEDFIPRFRGLRGVARMKLAIEANDEARDIYQEVIRLGSLHLHNNPSDLVVRYGLARAYHNLALLLEIDGEPERSKSSFEEAIKFQSDCVESSDPLFQQECIKALAQHYSALGGFLYRHEGVSQAIEAFEHSLAHNSRDPRTRHALAVAYTNAGRGEDACEVIELLLAGTPDSRELTYLLGSAQMICGRLDRASAAFRRVLSLSEAVNDEFYSDTLFRLGICEIELGNLSEAIEILGLLSPNDPDRATELQSAIDKQRSNDKRKE